ncbi:prolyl oligopeptidase family serine peptidase [Nonomuraea sp. NPDC046570]|uniref:prolyl oligopeptidase family serine peptidase n=1 Tax=Nonomuraea sp. NPDC046570 TaxID=3155255 RepID=UPI003401E430
MYPPAPRLDLVEPVHGIPVADPYRWLEDPDDPATKEWQVAQDDLYLEHAQDLHHRDRFHERLTRLQSAGFVGPPSWHGERHFFVRRAPGQEHLALHTVDPDGTERVLLDPAGSTVIDAWQPSPDGALLAYQLSSGGREESLLSVLDVATGQVVDGPIDRCRSTLVAWLPDGDSFLYVRRLPPEQAPPGEERYHRRVYLHRVGTDPAEDELVFGEGRDKATHYRVNVTHGWLTISASLGTSPRNDLWIAELSSRPWEPRAVQEGVDAHTALRVGRDGRAYLMTDRDAPRGRIVVTDPADPGVETWRELIPEDPEAVLSDFALLDGADGPVLVLSRTRHAVTELTRHDARTGAPTGTVPVPGIGTAAALTTRPEGGSELWFAYTDTTTPVSVQRYDARTGETTLWAAPPGSARPPRVDSREVEFRSKDGTLVRMLVLAPPETSGPRPCLLAGYGGFGVSMVPAFNPQALAWVEAGGVYAVARLRGGGEEGERWHRAGMRAAKQNVFDDFHAAAEALVAGGWTSADRLAVTGGSNGGLLVGAALTQRPELYAAAACSAPLLDMVRYERSGLGAAWSTEYGSAAVPEEFGWLYGYSPYHHVRPGLDYPAVLFTVADGDTRVDPFHARKMCAALQWASRERAERGQAAPVLLRTEGEVGHGARAVTSTIALEADVLAFCAAHTGLR